MCHVTSLHCYKWSNILCHVFLHLQWFNNNVLRLHLCHWFSNSVAGLHCYQWSNVLPDSAVKYVCTGSTATFSWNVSLAAGEEIVNIRWLFQGHSEEVVAILSHGTFVALPAFSKTASYVPNAGIALGHVTVSDRGKYSVEVTGHNSSGVEFTLLRSAVLHVGR